jgi:hypothetical protein
VKFEKRDNENHELVLNGKGLDDKGKGSADMLLHAKLKEGCKRNFNAAWK